MTSSAESAFELICQVVDSGRIPGAVLGVLDSSGSVQIFHRGYAQITPTSRVMQPDYWFDLASLTKVLFTTPRILEHACNNVLDLDAPLTTWLPDLRQYDNNCWEREVTFRQCLSHQTRFPAVEPLYTYGQPAELLRAFILQRQWQVCEPAYSDINFILLGLALERIEGCRIRDMNPGDGFAFTAAADSAVATENCTWRHRVLCGEVHDDNCYALEGAGHAGLFGTAASLLTYAQGLLAQSVHPPQVCKWIQAAQTMCYTHGWQRAHDGWSGGASCSAETIGHTGFTGTGLWVDLSRRCAWTLLTNRIHPTRHTDSGIVDLRRAVSDAICQR